MVGPGAMAPYGGGGGRRRHGGYVRVQDPAKGFFLAGSTVMAMNGLYGRVDSVPSDLKQTVQLAYKHDKTNWLMCLTSGKATPEGKDEWLLIDDANRPRFQHAGRTIIPGSGKRWRHLHRQAQGDGAGDGDEKSSSSSTALQAHGDDYSQLPWQVIAILDESMLAKLRRYQAHHHGNIQRAISGGNLPPTQQPHLAEPPAHLDGTSAAVGEPDAVDICANNEDGVRAAESLFGAMLDANTGTSEKSRWTRAQVYVQLAQCHRRTARDVDAGLVAVEGALRMFPSFKRALFERGLLLMDAGGRAREAAIAFAQVLRLDRNYPRLDMWLTRAEAQERRTSTAAKIIVETMLIADAANSDCLAWRQTANCDPAQGPREPEYDKACNVVIAPRVSGYCECASPSLSKADATERGQLFAEHYARAKARVSRAGLSSCERDSFVCSDECRTQWQDTLEMLRKSSDAVQIQVADLLSAWKDEARDEDHARELERRTERARAGGHHGANGGEARRKVDALPKARKAAWEAEDHYGVLGLAQDFTQSELKRAYRQRAKENHPDKKGGSDEAFQRVGAAQACLSDTALRQDYDMGKDLDSPDKEERTHWENTERRYFPERYGFHPFGDPLEDSPDGQEAHRQHQEQIDAARQRDAAAIGQGSGNSVGAAGVGGKAEL